MKRYVARGVNGALSRLFGLSLHKEATVVDLTSSGLDPLEAHHRLPRHPHLVAVPTSKCRVFPPMCFRCEPDSGSPFVESALAYAVNGRRDYEGSSLQHYYERWNPASARDVVGAAGKDGYLATAHQDTWFFPWHNSDTRKHLEEDGDRGMGRSEWGPVAKDHGEIEMRRLVTVYESIRANGFTPGGRHGYIGRSEVLVRDHDYAVLIYGGQHRASVLGAMGLGEVPVCFAESGRPRFWLEIVERTHVERWPGVRDGYYSSREALEVFDRAFEGRQPFDEITPI